MLCRNALISGPVLGMCNQFEGEGGAGGGEGAGAAAAADVETDVEADAREDTGEYKGGGEGGGEGESTGAGAGVRGPALVAIGDGLRGGEMIVGRSSGRVSIGTRAMRVRVCRRGCCGAERVNRDRAGSPGSKSCKGGRAVNELNVGAKSRGEWKEVFVLGVGGGLDWVCVSGCVVRILGAPKREYSGPEVLESGSRSGTDASTERVRLWTSRRLLPVRVVTSLEDEPSACLFLRLEALRRAKGTTMRTKATTKITPPTAATMMMASLLLDDDWWVEDGVALC